MANIVREQKNTNFLPIKCYKIYDLQYALFFIFIVVFLKSVIFTGDIQSQLL